MKALLVFGAHVVTAKELLCDVPNMTIEYVHIQDTTRYFNAGEMKDLVLNMAEVLSGMTKLSPSTKSGVVSYEDKNRQPFGEKDAECFELHSPLSAEPLVTLAAMMTLGRQKAGDAQESQLDALLRVGLPSVGWSLDSNGAYAHVDENTGYPIYRFISIRVYKEPHFAFDYLTESLRYKPSDGTGNRNCHEEDYPTMDQVAAKLVGMNAGLVFYGLEAQLERNAELIEGLASRGVHVTFRVLSQGNISECILDALEELVCEKPPTLPPTTTMEGTWTLPSPTLPALPWDKSSSSSTTPEPSSTSTSQTNFFPPIPPIEELPSHLPPIEELPTIPIDELPEGLPDPIKWLKGSTTESVIAEDTIVDEEDSSVIGLAIGVAGGSMLLVGGAYGASRFFRSVPIEAGYETPVSDLMVSERESVAIVDSDDIFASGLTDDIV